MQVKVFKREGGVWDVLIKHDRYMKLPRVYRKGLSKAEVLAQVNAEAELKTRVLDEMSAARDAAKTA